MILQGNLTHLENTSIFQSTQKNITLSPDWFLYWRFTKILVAFFPESVATFFMTKEGVERLEFQKIKIQSLTASFRIVLNLD